MVRPRVSEDRRRRRVVLYVAPETAAALDALDRGQAGRWVDQLVRAALAGLGVRVVPG